MQAELQSKGGKVMPQWACLLDTKGPEIRTAMLRDGKDIDLVAGQTILIEAVGAAYTSYEGYKDEATGETKIGLSYAKLCTSVQAGNKILLADGSISIVVEEILSTKLLRGTVLNSKKLGQRKNCNLPGVKVEIPVLTEKDIDDLKNFAAKHEMDYVAASFVQSAADVQFIRRVLDEGGGTRVKIISKIENAEGLVNYDEILRESDGIMVARGDLGMEIAAEKVRVANSSVFRACPFGRISLRPRFTLFRPR
jgi:pyruvate kinase